MSSASYVMIIGAQATAFFPASGLRINQEAGPARGHALLLHRTLAFPTLCPTLVFIPTERFELFI
jgi:hypothetical protein